MPEFCVCHTHGRLDTEMPLQSCCAGQRCGCDAAFRWSLQHVDICMIHQQAGATGQWCPHSAGCLGDTAASGLGYACALAMHLNWLYYSSHHICSVAVRRPTQGHCPSAGDGACCAGDEPTSAGDCALHGAIRARCTSDLCLHTQHSIETGLTLRTRCRPEHGKSHLANPTCRHVADDARKLCALSVVVWHVQSMASSRSCRKQSAHRPSCTTNSCATWHCRTMSGILRRSCDAV
jgi:hypothetical protein